MSSSSDNEKEPESKVKTGEDVEGSSNPTRCTRCFQIGHRSNECRTVKRRISDWVARRKSELKKRSDAQGKRGGWVKEPQIKRRRYAEQRTEENVLSSSSDSNSEHDSDSNAEHDSDSNAEYDSDSNAEHDSDLESSSGLASDCSSGVATPSSISSMSSHFDDLENP